jgi:hypothetical protein
MAWVLPAAQSARFFVVVVMTWLVALARSRARRRGIG